LQKKKSKKETDQIKVISAIYGNLINYFTAKRAEKIEPLCAVINKANHHDRDGVRKIIDATYEKDAADPVRAMASKIIGYVNPMNRHMPKNMLDQTNWDRLVRECKRYLKPYKDEIGFDDLHRGKLQVRSQWSEGLHQ
jgi:hypothetical protein